MAQDGPIWNPDGLGLAGDNTPPSEAVEPARGQVANDVGDAQLVQPGVLNGAVPQDGSGPPGTSVAVRAVVIDPGTGLPTTTTINVLT